MKLKLLKFIARSFIAFSFYFMILNTRKQLCCIVVKSYHNAVIFLSSGLSCQHFMTFIDLYDILNVYQRQMILPIPLVDDINHGDFSPK